MPSPPSDPTQACDPGRADRLEEVLAGVLEHEAAARDRHLEKACLRHPGLAEELRALYAELVRVGVDTFRSEPTPRALGGFRLVRRIGEGGMGVVFLAEQSSLGREVALKLIRPDWLHSPAARSRFRREARAMGRLHHPGIVRVHAFGDEDGVPFLAMDWIEGRTLQEVLDGARASGRPGWEGVRAALAEGTELPGELAGPWWRSVAWIGREVARALEHAHGHGVLHRDLKPSNVMLSRDGRVLLFDFGLAHTGEDDRLTRSGSQPGSLPYMAPEQVRGAGESIGGPTDVYGLGATLFELLCLEPPFGAGSRSALERRILTEPARDARRFGVPRGLAAVVERCLRKEPERRYPSVPALRADLERVLEGRPTEARAGGRLERLWLRIRYRPRRFALLFVSSVAALFLVLVLLLVPFVGEARLLRGERDVEDLVARGFDSLAEIRFRKARAELLGALELQPRHPQAVAGLVALYLRRPSLGDPMAVITDHQPLTDEIEGLGWIRAALLRREGREAEARSLEEGLPLPDDALSMYLYALRLREAVCREVPEALDEACEWLRRCKMSREGGRLLYLLELAHVLGHDDRPGRAEDRRTLARYLEEHWVADSRRARLRVAFLYPRRSPERLAAMERAAADFPGALARAARILSSTGECGRALEVLAAAPPRWQRLTVVQRAKMIVLRRAGDHAASLRVGSRLLERLPDDPHVLHSQAITCKVAGDLERAEQLVRRRLAVRDDSASRGLLAGILWARGDHTQALREWRRATEVGLPWGIALVA